MTAIYYGFIALRHHYQIKFSEMHSVLSGKDREDVCSNAKSDKNNFRKADDTTTPLETSGDALSWKILKQEGLEPVANDPSHAILPKYTPDIEELNNQNVTIQGYMFPLDSMTSKYILDQSISCELPLLLSSRRNRVNRGLL